MKNKVKYILGLITIVVIVTFGIYFWLLSGNNTEPPERLTNIPETAIWKGGADGGYWYDIVNIDNAKKSYRFRIYDDYEGGLVLDADFIKNASCDDSYSLDRNILEKVNYFNFDKIVMIGNCELNIIEPVYGGELLKNE
jgi:hypothetical protein